MVATLLAGCKGAAERKAARDDIADDIAEQLAPLQDDVDAAVSVREFEPLSDQLRSRIRDLTPPDGVKAITLTSTTWSEFSENPDERRSVGNAVVVIPNEPTENEPYCLGVTVDNLDGVVMTPGANASVAEGCANIARPAEP